MFYCNDFYSLSVLSLYEGELLGMVNKLCFDKKLKKLIHIELLNDDGIILILPIKNIYHVGKNAITVKNNQAVSLKVEESELLSCPINSKAYSIQGEYLGIIKELTITEKYTTEKILLDNNTTLSISNLASCWKNTVIFYTEQEKIKIQKFTPSKSPKTFKIENVQVAEILPIEISPQAELIQPKPKQNQSSTFLVGRVCTKDIFNFNNELIIKSGTQVTKKVLKEVNKFGKLRELMLYCK